VPKEVRFEEAPEETVDSLHGSKGSRMNRNKFNRGNAVRKGIFAGDHVARRNEFLSRVGCNDRIFLNGDTRGHHGIEADYSNSSSKKPAPAFRRHD
jgi:hypothetical protein